MTCQLFIHYDAVNSIPGGGIGRQVVETVVMAWNVADPLPQLLSDPPSYNADGTAITNYRIAGRLFFPYLAWTSPPPYLYLVGCGAPPPTLDPGVPCDCINGGCLPKTTYNTPGKYASLALCQAGCAKDSVCVGECVSPSDLAALQQAANLVKSKLCG
jgi:hypothetical protein